MSLLKKSMRNFLEILKTTEISEKNVEKVLKEFHLLLIKNSVNINVSKEIINKTKKKLVGERAKRFSEMRLLLLEALKESIIELLTPSAPINFIDILEKKKLENNTNPLIILFLGINGTGKTTTVAKVAYLLSRRKYRLVIAASDTFRSGAQEQIKTHADRLKIKCVEGKYGSDPSSVAYDAIHHAIARKLNVVLIDTAGRMAINHDLIEEMKKIKRITNPDLTIFVGDALAGNDAVNQAKEFDSNIGIDGTILCKMDAVDK
ncbi:MAG: signal recognition particle receptor subunit alpha, partial [Candidatus Heimdallarchaeota archaeon]